MPPGPKSSSGADWVRKVTEAVGTPPPGVDPSRWEPGRALSRARQDADTYLTAAETAVQAARRELQRLSGWGADGLGQAMKELDRFDQSLAKLRELLGHDTPQPPS